MRLTAMKLRAIPILALFLFLTACGGGGGGGGGDGGDPPPPPPVIQVAVTPADVQVAPGATQPFTCAVTGSSNTTCTWRVEEAGGGAITAQGLYAAPNAAGTFHVIPASTADASRTARATVRVGTAPPPATPWVTGYYAGWFWDVMYPPQEVDMTAMTHFVFGRVAPGGGSLGGTPGQLEPGAGSGHEPGRLPNTTLSVEDYLIDRAHDAGTKALLMLGGDGPDGEGFVLSSADGVRATFVRNIVDYLVAHDYDGVDVDWESCLMDGCFLGTSREVSGPEAVRRLKALLTEIRAEANTRPRFSGANDRVIVTLPGYAVSINFLEPGDRVQQWQADVANMVDQYNLMSYGAGMTFSGGGWDSWFTTPIFGATGATPYDLETSIQAYVNTGVPRSRLGIGIGFYGIYYGPGITGPRQPTALDGTYITDDRANYYGELVRLGYMTHGTLHWDEVSKSSYRSYPGGYTPANDPERPAAGYLSFEDERSIAAKGQWVRDTGVGGAIIWTINYGYLPDTGRNPLLAAVKESFLEP